MEVSIVSGLSVALVLGLIGLVAASAAPKVQRRPVTIKKDDSKN